MARRGKNLFNKLSSHVAVGLFSNRSQMTSQCGTIEWQMITRDRKDYLTTHHPVRKYIHKLLSFLKQRIIVIHLKKNKLKWLCNDELEQHNHSNTLNQYRRSSSLWFQSVSSNTETDSGMIYDMICELPQYDKLSNDQRTRQTCYNYIQNDSGLQIWNSILEGKRIFLDVNEFTISWENRVT